ncbi:hypothetical protein ABTW66_19815, partial [Microbacterium oxydans]
QVPSDVVSALPEWYRSTARDLPWRRPEFHDESAGRDRPMSSRGGGARCPGWTKTILVRNILTER